eukprot:1335502-Ditylum_brightwellii.AAC.1
MSVTVAVFCAITSPEPPLLAFANTARCSVIGAANLYFAYREEESSYINTYNTLSLSRNPLMHT